MSAADGWHGLGEVLANSRHEAGQCCLLDLVVIGLADGDGWDGFQWLLELVCHLAHLFQVLAALGGVGAADDRFDVFDLDAGSAVAGELLVGLAGEDSHHQAVDVFDGQGLASVFLLEGVDLDVVDGTSLDLVAVAL